MGTMKRIVTVVTARPSFARIQTALEALEPRCHLIVVLAGAALGREYGDITEDLETALGIKPICMYGRWDDPHPAGMAVTTGYFAADMAKMLRSAKADAVMVVADRHEVLGAAMAAAYQNIPVIHVQGGEVSGSIDNKVRHAITQLADLHLVATDLAWRRVYDMTGALSQCFIAGCPSIDLAKRAVQQPLLCLPPGGVGGDFSLDRAFLVLMLHPDTTKWLGAGSEAEQTLQAMARIGCPVVAFWPNVDAGRESIAKVYRQLRERYRNFGVENWRFYRHLPAETFYRLVNRSACLVGNSSAGIRECSFLGVPAVNVGTRQDGRERAANVVDVAADADRIVMGIGKWLTVEKPVPSRLYGDGRAGEKIAQAVLTYLGVGDETRSMHVGGDPVHGGVCARAVPADGQENRHV